MLLILLLTYLEIGIAIGLQELGCSPHDATAFSRRSPFRHVVLQCILWPLLYLIVRPESWFEKIIKLTVIICILIYAQKLVFPWVTVQMGQWAFIPTAIAGILAALGLFAFLRMPGFKPKF